jgi:succinate dehydrogenase / fumarate reductase cytochrome b subunit
VSLASPSIDPAGRWSSTVHRLAGLVLSVYLVFTLAELAVLRRDPSMFNRFVEWRDSLALRLVAWVVVVTLVFHGLNGLRIVALEATRAHDRRAVTSKGVVVFLTALSVFPLGAFVLRPQIDGWWP